MVKRILTLNFSTFEMRTKCLQLTQQIFCSAHYWTWILSRLIF